jgi:hypothetical protein
MLKVNKDNPEDIDNIVNKINYVKKLVYKRDGTVQTSDDTIRLIQIANKDEPDITVENTFKTLEKDNIITVRTDTNINTMTEMNLPGQQVIILNNSNNQTQTQTQTQINNVKYHDQTDSDNETENDSEDDDGLTFKGFMNDVDCMEDIKSMFLSMILELRDRVKNCEHCETCSGVINMVEVFTAEYKKVTKLAQALANLFMLIKNCIYIKKYSDNQKKLINFAYILISKNSRFIDIQYLYDNFGSNIDINVYNGLSMLLAVQKYEVDDFNKLVEWGGDITVRNHRCIIRAFHYEKFEIARYLIKKGSSCKYFIDDEYRKSPENATRLLKKINKAIISPNNKRDLYSFKNCGLEWLNEMDMDEYKKLSEEIRNELLICAYIEFYVLIRKKVKYESNCVENDGFIDELDEYFDMYLETIDLAELGYQCKKTDKKKKKNKNTTSSKTDSDEISDKIISELLEEEKKENNKDTNKDTNKSDSKKKSKKKKKQKKVKDNDTTTTLELIPETHDNDDTLLEQDTEDITDDIENNYLANNKFRLLAILNNNVETDSSNANSNDNSTDNSIIEDVKEEEVRIPIVIEETQEEKLARYNYIEQLLEKGYEILNTSRYDKHKIIYNIMSLDIKEILSILQV